MKAKFGAIVTTGSGKLGGQMFAQTSHGIVMKTVGTYNQNATLKQRQQRLKTQQIMSSYSFLTDEERALWELMALQYSKIDRFGAIRAFNGFQLFNRINQMRNLLEQPQITTPLPFGLAVYPTMLDVQSSETSLFIQSYAYPDNDIIILSATPSVGFGISKPDKFLRHIGQVTGLQLSQGVDILPMYLETFNQIIADSKIYLGLQTASSVSYYTNKIKIVNEPGIIIGENPPLVFDPDALAFINMVGTLLYFQKVAINDLVLGLKANGTWSSYYAIYPFIGGTATAHKWNLKNPIDSDAAFRLVFGGDWVHNENGITGNGTNTFADTFFTKNSGWSATNVMYGVYSRTSSAQEVCEFGMQNLGNLNTRISVHMRWSNDDTISDIFNTTTGRNSNDNFNALGYFQMQQRGGTSHSIYKNGAILGPGVPGNASASFPLLQTNSMYIGAANAGNSPIRIANRNLALVCIGQAQLATQASSDYDVFQAYQTALDRQV